MALRTMWEEASMKFEMFRSRYHTVWKDGGVHKSVLIETGWFPLEDVENSFWEYFPPVRVWTDEEKRGIRVARNQ